MSEHSACALPRYLQCGSYRLSLERPLIMGVVNVTPDSFSDGGLHATCETAIAHAQRLVGDGADIIDIGGESTRPGARPVALAEERRRVLPVIAALASCGVPISVDTRKPELMREAIEAGASMVNDIEALQTAAALKIVADTAVAVCLMHKQGDPQSMQQNPKYDHVVREVREYLLRRLDAALAAGIERERVTIDPGFGFGKTYEHNLSLLRGLAVLNELGVPVLAGLSRKAMLGRITGRKPQERVHASTAAALFAAEQGAMILRVHDVTATRDVLAVWRALKGTIDASAIDATG